MKKLLLVLLLSFTPQIYCQNIIKVGRSLRTLKPTYIERTIHTNIAKSFQAIEIAKYQSLNTHTNWYFKNTPTKVDVYIKRKLLEQTLKSPNRIYGPYNYVRVFSRISKDESLTTGKHLQAWKHINQTTGYNGAHHIINKYTIKILHQELKKEGKNVSLSDMQNNAPAMFHPLHGDKRFQHYFHNPVAQLSDYHLYGMKITVMSLLAEIDEIGAELGLTRMPEDYINGILKETELWCKTYGLVWERDGLKLDLDNYEVEYIPLYKEQLFKE